MDAAKLSRLILYTRDLTKTQTFYSILGIKWLGGSGPEEIGHSGLPALVGIQLVRQTIFVKIPAIAAELFFRERLGARNPATGHAALEAARSPAVLHGVYLGR